ncbi:MAG: HAD family hydrolase [Candidatus Hodarchaeales archaeon]
MNTQKSGKLIGLACIDLDGTLTSNRSSWEFIFHSLGLWETVGAKNLDMFLKGEIGYEEFAALDVAAWKGLEEREYMRILASIPMNRGIKELVDFLQRIGFRTYIVSAGLYRFAKLSYERYGFNGFYGNEVEIVDGRLTGRMRRINVQWDGKRAIIRDLKHRYGVPKTRVISMGDTSGDLKMFEESRIKVAVNSTDETLRKSATITFDSNDLRELIPLLDEEIGRFDY